jgi:hypothetical protein
MLPSANADAPTSLSNLLLFGLHRIGESPHAGSRRVPAKPLLTIHLAKRTAWNKGRRPPLPPVRESRLRAAASPAFDEAPHECLKRTLGRNF